MALSSPRYKILPLRGTYSALAAEVGNILDGEICYAIDQDQYYQNEGGTLVAVGATKAQGALADSAVQPGDNVSDLANDAGYITLAQVPADAVTSVNTQTGAVVLDADDIDDTSTTNKFTTTADISKLAGIEAGAQVNEVEEAPTDGGYYVRQNSSWVPNTSVPVDLSNNTLDELSDVSVPSAAIGEALIFDGSEWVAGGDLIGGNF